MKNIHVLQTDKPSRLVIDTIENKLYLQPILHEKTVNILTQNIYITSDEEIREGDYIFETDSGYVNIACKNYYKNSTDFKIILTTDQYLIKDGVQAIDDEFLEWFVKNPSCESVEVDREEDELVSPKNPKIRFNYLQDPPSFISAESLNNMILTYKYKIIIPQEKPKQEHNKYLSCCRSKEECHCKEEPKQETLEEACKRIKNELDYSEFDYTSFKLGAKWQQEQDKNKYSEEEVFKLICDFNYDLQIDEVKDIKDWFEQFKNK